jgi:ribonuclease HI
MRIRIYTDGSYNKEYNAGAWAIIICDEKGIKNLAGVKKNVTNNNMELKAVNEALAFSWLKKYKEVEILTDSAYVINTINQKLFVEWEKNGWKTVKKEDIKNKEEWIEFCKLKKILKKLKVKIIFTKIKSHSNNLMNDKADYLAKTELNNYISKGAK